MSKDRIAEDCRGLAALLDGLNAEQWDAPSLCHGWAVRHVVAHLTMPFRYSPARFALAIARAGGSFRRMSDAVASRDAALPAAQLIAALRANAEDPWKPPGGGYDAGLTHNVIHGLDITVPLGIERQVPAASMRAVLDVVVTPKSQRHFGTDLAGLQLRAADIDWSSGSGAPLVGRAQDLALLLTGRRVPEGAFTGDGAALRAGAAR